LSSIGSTLADKNPQAYFNGAVALARVIKWETDEEQGGGAMTPDEIIAKLEQRVGPEGRRLFERFLRRGRGMAMARRPSLR
jgi:hypothetical protein